MRQQLPDRLESLPITFAFWTVSIALTALIVTQLV